MSIQPPTYYRVSSPEAQRVRDAFRNYQERRIPISRQEDVDFDKAVEPYLQEIERCSHLTAKDLATRVR